MLIRPMRADDLDQVIRIWNACVNAGEVLYSPLTEDYFRRKFVDGEGCEPENLLVAEASGQVAGFIHGVAPGTFRLSRPGQAYLTVILVDPARRGQGVGAALLQALIARMKSRGAAALSVSSLNPVNLDWRIPGTPGHDHNNMPGLDNGCAGFGFFGHRGFERRHDEVSMYINLADYRMPEGVAALREKLAREGIQTGPYDARLMADFDGMCDRVGSDYWRDVLRTETAAWLRNEPNADSRMWADGIRPAGPRVILAAVSDGRVVGFTGPVDKQKSGRGWFTGICTDPLFERRGIATVLFNLLMQAFVDEGAAFSTLFTGADNHAQKIYRGAGMRPVRQFSIMTLDLSGKGGNDT
ncbi:MAG: GNAT family N-acetyltransferase [Clostridia bacterium]|nr:GNAT family N-acetyltransferase [Clostridia bacterium]